MYRVGAKYRHTATHHPEQKEVPLKQYDMGCVCRIRTLCSCFFMDRFFFFLEPIQDCSRILAHYALAFAYVRNMVSLTKESASEPTY